MIKHYPQTLDKSYFTLIQHSDRRERVVAFPLDELNVES